MPLKIIETVVSSRVAHNNPFACKKAVVTESKYQLVSVHNHKVSTWNLKLLIIQYKCYRSFKIQYTHYVTCLYSIHNSYLRLLIINAFDFIIFKMAKWINNWNGISIMFWHNMHFCGFIANLRLRKKDALVAIILKTYCPWNSLNSYQQPVFFFNVIPTVTLYLCYVDANKIKKRKIRGRFFVSDPIGFLFKFGSRLFV